MYKKMYIDKGCKKCENGIKGIIVYNYASGENSRNFKEEEYKI